MTPDTGNVNRVRKMMVPRQKKNRNSPVSQSDLRIEESFYILLETLYYYMLGNKNSYVNLLAIYTISYYYKRYTYKLSITVLGNEQI